MPMDRFYIGPMESGQQTSLKPFAIADDAYELLRNAFIYRGRVRKRFGATLFHPGNAPFADAEQLQSRARHLIGVTNGVTGNFNGFVPRTIAGAPTITPAIGQMFSIDEVMFTVNALGAPAPLLRSDNLPLAATFDTTAGVGGGAVAIVGGGLHLNKNVYYYPSLPIVGIAEYELHTINDEKTIIFDTRYAYETTADGWSRLGLETDVWSGNDNDFFWTTTWRGATAYDNMFFVTNNLVADEMRYWSTATGWVHFTPIYWHDAAPLPVKDYHITTARIIVPFKNRLLLLNTYEDGNTYSNRCRFSWTGDPLDVDAFREDLNYGGFEEVPVQEAIITVQNLRDRLIVYCERSTWELVPTGVDIRPFVFQQINTELGVESTFSQIPFDQVVLGIGNVGIHACDGNSVKRIDEKIPYEVFQIHNINAALERVCGIRDYYAEQAYWSIPSRGRNINFPYPDRVLVFNYLTGSWAYNDDSITAFGYIQNVATGGAIWASAIEQWGTSTSIWADGQIQPKARRILAGNQEGFVFIVDVDEAQNCAALQITDVYIDAGTGEVHALVINHNLKDTDYVHIQNCKWSDGMSYLEDWTLKVFSVVNRNVISLGTFVIGPIYIGNGTVARANVIEILTKRFNFYSDKGRNVAISKVDFLVDKTVSGEITVDYRLSNSLINMSDEAAVVNPDGTTTVLGTNVLETKPYALVPFEQSQEQFWHSLYPQAQGEFIQLHLYLSDWQMLKIPDSMAPMFVWQNDFQLHGIIFLAQPITRF
jgi:hypothetical protein